MRLLVLHDDGGWEFDHKAGAEKALEQAGTDGWTVASIKDDWGNRLLTGTNMEGREGLVAGSGLASRTSASTSSRASPTVGAFTGWVA